MIADTEAIAALIREVYTGAAATEIVGRPVDVIVESWQGPDRVRVWICPVPRHTALYTVAELTDRDIARRYNPSRDPDSTLARSIHGWFTALCAHHHLANLDRRGGYW